MQRSRCAFSSSSGKRAARLTAIGPTRAPVSAWRSSASRMPVSQASNSSKLLPFCRGRPAIRPALHASRTRSGPLTRNIGAQIAGKAICARIFGSSAIEAPIQAIELPRRTAIEPGLLLSARAFGDALECVPQRLVAAGDAVDRKVALEHATLRPEGFDADLEPGAP